jgi:hypothetical protein
MGLLDFLQSGNGGGGLLDMLMQRSPLQDEKVSQPQYDPMGNYTGVTPQQVSDPFPKLPDANYAQFAPKITSPLYSPFNQGAAPMAGMMPPAQQPQSMPQAPAAAPAQSPAPDNNPVNMMDIGGYKMPQYGSISDYTPTNSLPNNAQAASGQTPTDVSAQSRQSAQPNQTFSSALDKPQGGFSGAFRGLAENAQNGPLGMLIGGIGGAMGAEDPSKQNLRAQYGALVQTFGNTPEGRSKAMLAIMNPEAGKVILQEALSSKEKYVKTGMDGLGNEQYGFVNERDQTVNGKPIGSETQSNGGSFLASGVKQIDSGLTGKDYLGQFSPEVQSAVQNYVDGKSLPTGNPRKGFTQTVKMIAQKYGADIGQPADDANYSARRTYLNSLSGASAATAGGQAKAFNQGIDHLDTLAGTLEKLDNSNGMGIPTIANATNSLRQGFSTSQSAISDEAKSLGQTVAGEVGKLFSGSAGGGVHEREMTRERFDTIKSKPQLAAALQATVETMRGGLRALEMRRDEVLGPNSGHNFINAETEQKMARIEGVISRLKGETSATSAAPGLPQGWSVKVR